MQKIKIIVPVIILLFGSCKKEIPYQSSIQDVESSYIHPSEMMDSIGYWHNQLLTKVNFAKAANANSTVESIRTEIWRIARKLRPNLFNDSTFQELKARSSLYSDFYERINHTDGDPEKLVYLSFNTMQENQLLNKELINALNRLFEERTNYSLEEQLIQFQQLQILCIHKDERQFIKIFIQVFEMSSKFWESNHVQHKADAQNLVVIWADAAGGLYGLLLGPVGSIVEAAVFSTIAAIQ